MSGPSPEERPELENPGAEMPGDYYALLGVARTASGGEIRAAYRARCAELEASGLGGARKLERVGQLSDALTVLGHAERRRIYDKYGRVPDPWANDGNRLALADLLRGRALLIGLASSALISLIMVSRLGALRLLSGGGLFAWAFALCLPAWGAGLLALAGGQLLALHFLKRVEGVPTLRQAEIAYNLLLFLVAVPVGRAFKAAFFFCVGASPSDFGAAGVLSWVDALWLGVCVVSYRGVVWHGKGRTRS